MITTELANQIKKLNICGCKISALWIPESLWGNKERKGLAILSNGMWTLVEYNISGGLLIASSYYERAHLISQDKLWKYAFEAIDSGVSPYFANKQCSCGATKIYGDSWPYHANECYINEPGFSFLVPKNNDGRPSCWVCGEPTIAKPLWNSLSNLCDNKKCKWYDR